MRLLYGDVATPTAPAAPALPQPAPLEHPAITRARAEAATFRGRRDTNVPILPGNISDPGGLRGVTDFDNTVRIHPLLLALGAQPDVNSTVVHELAHVDQNRAATASGLDKHQQELAYLLERLKNGYQNAPAEVDARSAEHRYWYDADKRRVPNDDSIQMHEIRNWWNSYYDKKR